MDKKHIIFDPPLIEGIIVKRKGQFIFIVKINDEEVACHCPTTGRIGNIDVKGRPCLLSKSIDSKRKTTYTVEAISLNKIDDTNKEWIGINQNAINRYVEYYLLNGGFSNMIGRENQVRRETFLGVSKLDFLVGNTYLEVKTPLQHLQIDIPEYVIKKKSTPFSSTERFIKHITELAKTLKNHERAILLNCFIYDNPGFQIIEKSTHYEEVKNAVDNSLKAGVELWQANFKITDKEIKLIKYFKITNI